MKIAFFGAHPGDLVEVCGCTLAKHARRGDQVSGVALTYGERYFADKMWLDPSGRPSLEAVKKARLEGMREAADLLGLGEVYCLDFGQPLMIDEEKFLKLIDMVRRLKPDVVITHHPLDLGTPDHGIAGDAVVRACLNAHSAGLQTEHPPCFIDRRRIYFGVTLSYHMPLHEAVPDVYIDVSETVGLIGRAYYACQRRTIDFTKPGMEEELEKLFKKYLAYHGCAIEVEYADAFKRLFRGVHLDYFTL